MLRCTGSALTIVTGASILRSCARSTAAGTASASTVLTGAGRPSVPRAWNSCTGKLDSLKISTSECQNSLIIDNFIRATIEWILTNQKIPETLSGAAYDVI